MVLYFLCFNGFYIEERHSELKALFSEDGKALVERAAVSLNERFYISSSTFLLPPTSDASLKEDDSFTLDATGDELPLGATEPRLLPELAPADNLMAVASSDGSGGRPQQPSSSSASSTHRFVNKSTTSFHTLTRKASVCMDLDDTPPKKQAKAK